MRTSYYILTLLCIALISAITIKAADGDIPPGSYAVSVTDNSSVQPDSASAIMTQLLLQSDLRGYVEDPSYYFATDDDSRDADLDALMLTQGWRRYDIPRTLRGRLAEPITPIEKGYEATGQVLSDWRKKPVEGASVQVIAPKLNYVDVFPTDANGRFTIKGRDFPDSTKLIVQAIDKKGTKLMNVSINDYRGPQANALPGAMDRQEELDDDDEYISHEASRILKKNGMSMVLLGEVVVRGTKIRQPADIFEAIADRTLTEEDMERMAVSTLESALRRFAGIYIKQGKAYSGRGMVRFYIDGVYFAPLDEQLEGGDHRMITRIDPHGGLSSASTGGSSLPTSNVLVGTSNENVLAEIEALYPMHVIKRIDYLLPGVAAALGHSHGMDGGAIVITTKDGSDYKRVKDYTMHLFKPFGYQKPVEFYSPDYAHSDCGIAPGGDQRNTIYWNPLVEVGSSGKSHFSFFTNDVIGTSYTITIEGVDSKGQIISAKHTVETK